MTVRTVRAAAALVAAGGTLAGCADAAPGAHDAAAPAGLSARTTAAEGACFAISRWRAVGGSAIYSGDSAGIGTATPVRFMVPDCAGGHRFTVTATMQYRTVGAGSFDVELRLRPDTAPSWRSMLLQGGARPVLPTRAPTTVTVAARTEPLTAGHSYLLDLGANVVPRKGQARTAIKTGHVVVTVFG